MESFIVLPKIKRGKSMTYCNIGWILYRILDQARQYEACVLLLKGQEKRPREKNWHQEANVCRAATACKALDLPRSWILIHSYKRQPVKNRIFGCVWLEFAVASLIWMNIMDNTWKTKLCSKHVLTLKKKRHPASFFQIIFNAWDSFFFALSKSLATNAFF